MSVPKVTIVVPVYNVSKYLSKCLDSLINQTLKEIEIVLINDASPDPEDDRICKEYVSKDQRIKYIVHDKNKGLGGARNTGIANTSSNYIGFVDSDDWVELNMFEKLYDAIQKEDADVSQCFFTEHIGTQSKTRRLKKFRKQDDFLNATNVLAWNKLFKKTLFTENKIFFPEHHSLEDIATIPRLMYFVDSMAQVKESLYNYMVTREGAITANYERIFSDHSVVFNLIKKFMIDKEVWNSHRMFFERRLIRSLLHDVSRLLKDTVIEEKKKKDMITNGLEKSTNLLRYPHKIIQSSLRETKKSLERYKRILIIKQLVRF
ncbi:glycosyltransferase family 2 protein [Ekhidna sp.]